MVPLGAPRPRARRALDLRSHRLARVLRLDLLDDRRRFMPAPAASRRRRSPSPPCRRRHRDRGPRPTPRPPPPSCGATPSCCRGLHHTRHVGDDRASSRPGGGVCPTEPAASRSHRCRVLCAWESRDAWAARRACCHHPLRRARPAARRPLSASSVVAGHDIGCWMGLIRERGNDQEEQTDVTRRRDHRCAPLFSCRRTCSKIDCCNQPVETTP